MICELRILLSSMNLQQPWGGSLAAKKGAWWPQAAPEEAGRAESAPEAEGGAGSAGFAPAEAVFR